MNTLMEHIDLIIETLILAGLGVAFFSQNKKLNVKIDKVLENQENQRVTLAETIKDVQSNKDWGQESKSKITNHATRINIIEIGLSALNEFKRNAEKK